MEKKADIDQVQIAMHFSFNQDQSEKISVINDSKTKPCLVKLQTKRFVENRISISKFAALASLVIFRFFQLSHVDLKGKEILQFALTEMCKIDK